MVLTTCKSYCLDQTKWVFIFFVPMMYLRHLHSIESYDLVCCPSWLANWSSSTLEACHAKVVGSKGACFKGFTSREEACVAFQGEEKKEKPRSAKKNKSSSFVFDRIILF